MSGYAILWVLLFGHVTALPRGTMPTRNLTAVVDRTGDHAIGGQRGERPDRRPRTQHVQG